MPRPITITTNPLSSKTLQTFEVNANNLVAMSKKLGTLIRRHKGSSKSNGTIAKELNNYVYADKGSKLYVDNYNHAIDAIRYNVIYHLDNPNAGKYFVQ